MKVIQFPHKKLRRVCRVAMYLYQEVPAVWCSYISNEPFWTYEDAQPLEGR